ncbi:hypothetical protein BJ166DRAFT_581422 [Pestalotiopsis sp. NC0098]|nr:hypothetical protein BJ166DRAFT_581422 [Pestalotiopsis sp. NC0098]
MLVPYPTLARLPAPLARDRRDDNDDDGEDDSEDKKKGRKRKKNSDDDEASTTPVTATNADFEVPNNGIFNDLRVAAVVVPGVNGQINFRSISLNLAALGAKEIGINPNPQPVSARTTHNRRLRPYYLRESGPLSPVPQFGYPASSPPRWLGLTTVNPPQIHARLDARASEHGRGMQDVLLRGCARHLIKVEGVAYHDYRPDVRFAIVKAMEENWDLFHCQAVDTFECRAMPDDPKHGLIVEEQQLMYQIETK